MQATTFPLLGPDWADREDGPPVIAAAWRAMPRATPLHAHRRGQLIGSLSGVLTIDTAQVRLAVPPGCAVWIPPRHRHGMQPHGACHGWSVYVAPHAVAATLALATPCVLQVPGLLKEAVLRAATWNPGDDRDAARRRVGAVILDEMAALPPQQMALPLPQERRLLKLARHLIAQPGEPRAMPALAAWIGVAPRTLTRRFNAETGMAFGDWRRRACLLRAVELLAAGVSVKAIALELGYDSLSAFILMFRRGMGVTPSHYMDSLEQRQQAA